MLVISLDVDESCAKAETDEGDEWGWFMCGSSICGMCGPAPCASEFKEKPLKQRYIVLSFQLLLGMCDGVERISIIDGEQVAKLRLGSFAPPAHLEDELLDGEGAVGDCVDEGVGDCAAGERVDVEEGDGDVEGAARGAVGEEGEDAAEETGEKEDDEDYPGDGGED